MTGNSRREVSSYFAGVIFADVSNSSYFATEGFREEHEMCVPNSSAERPRDRRKRRWLRGVSMRAAP